MDADIALGVVWKPTTTADAHAMKKDNTATSPQRSV